MDDNTFIEALDYAHFYHLGFQKGIAKFFCKLKKEHPNGTLIFASRKKLDLVDLFTSYSVDEKYRQCFSMMYCENYTAEETAEKLNIDRKTVFNYIDKVTPFFGLHILHILHKYYQVDLYPDMDSDIQAKFGVNTATLYKEWNYRINKHAENNF